MELSLNKYEKSLLKIRSHVCIKIKHYLLPGHRLFWQCHPKSFKYRHRRNQDLSRDEKKQDDMRKYCNNERLSFILGM